MRKNNLLEVHVSGKSVLLNVIESIESTEWFEKNLMVRSNRQNELSAFFSLWNLKKMCVINFEVQLCNCPFDIDEIKEIKEDLINKLKSLADNFETSMQYAESFYSYSERAEIKEECLEG